MDLFQPRDERRVLLAITVEIEDGRVEHMEMREGDSAEEVSAKFCQDHGVSSQFVAPLTEHILNNLMSTSFERKEVTSYSQGNRMLKEVNSEQIKDLPSAVKTREENLQHFFFLQQGDMNGYRHRTWFSKASFLQDGSRAIQTLKKVFKGHRLSERLISPTFTSMAKSRMTGQKEKRRHPRKPEQLSEREKAIFMRLYEEFMKHKEKVEEGKRLSFQLYREKIKSNKPVLSKKTRRIIEKREREAKQFSNYGELLYQEAKSKEERMKKLIEVKKQEDEIKELEQVTLKPRISKLARQLRRQGGEVWERLWHQRPRKDYLQELRSELLEATLMECTFKPRINRHDESFPGFREMSANHHMLSRFEQLFWDAENRRKRQAEYSQWYPEGVTFRPTINRQRQLVRDHMEDECSGVTVFDRLVRCAEKLSEKKQKLQKIRNKPVDSTTGQTLFKPMTGREPQFKRNIKSLPIGEFLYQMKYVLDNKRHMLEEQDKKERIKLANGQYVNLKSRQLLEQLKERKLRQIFDLLDADKDDLIDLAAVDTRWFPDEVAEDIAELKKSGEPLDSVSFQQFVKLMSNIHDQKPMV